MEKTLPKNWVETEVGVVSEIIRGITYNKLQAKPIKENDDYLILRGGNIQDGKITTETNDVVYVESSLVKTEQEIKKGDVVIVGSTGSKKLIGKAGIALEDFKEISFGAFLMLIRPSKSIEASLFDYYFISDNYRNVIRDLAGGVNINNIRREYITNLKYSLPPLAEQRRIVAKLDELFGHLDALKTRLKHIPQILKNFREAVLTQAVTGKLTEEWSKVNNFTDIEETIKNVPSIKLPSRYKSRNTSIIPGRFAISVGKPNLSIPKRYKWVELVKVARLETGHTPSRKYSEYWGGSVNWIGLADAREHHGKTIYQTIQKTNELGLNNSAARMLPKGTVCLSRTASVGYVTIMGIDMATSQDFVNWVCSQAVNPNWLKILLMAEKTSIVNFGKGTTHTTVYFPEVISINVSLPPIEEQSEIVKQVEDLFTKADNIETQYQNLKTKVDSLPQAILAKAFKGELVEQLPTDGDAKELLEEIEKLKMELADKKKTGKKK